MPACLRCVQSGRACEGYRTTPGSTADRLQSGNIAGSDKVRDPTPTSGLLDGLRQPLEEARLARVGCSLLSHDSYGQFGAAGSILEILLPQLSHAIPIVNAAAAALGAIYELQTLSPRTSDRARFFAGTLYGKAISGTQQALVTQPHGSVPLLMVCTLLAFAEIFLCREQNALLHLQGAFKLLELRQAGQTTSGARAVESAEPTNCASEDNISMLFRTLDIQTASYSLAHYPDMPISSLLAQLPPVVDVTTARLHLIPLVHRCYQFTTTASKYKYHPRAASSDLVITQGRLIGQLRLWLDALDQYISSKASDSPSYTTNSSHSHILILRVLCLATIIWTSAVLDPYETSYDAHAVHFQRIVTDAAQILANRSAQPRPSLLREGQRFSPGPGIIQPLFLTAIKYRNPVWRRRAVNILRDAGREGPWHGPRIAKAALRTAEIEEAYVLPESDLRVGIDCIGAIEERNRVHGCCVIPQTDTGERQTDELVSVKFSRCPDIEKLVHATAFDHDGVEYPACEDETYWELWDELIA